MAIYFNGQSIEIYTQPIQWPEFDRYQQDLEVNHKANVTYGFTGSLCYLNHHDFFDPWQLAGKQVLETAKKPLVAVNPVYHHPYIVARSCFTISQWLNQPIALNFIAGTSANDMKQIGSFVEKSSRYQRLDEFMTILDHFFSSSLPLSFSGDYYQLENASFTGTMNHKPDFFVAGHSSNAIELASKHHATRAQSLLSNLLSPVGSLEGQALGFGLHLAESATVGKSELAEILNIDRASEVMFRLKMDNTDGEWKSDQRGDLKNEALPNHYFPDTIKSAANVPFITGDLKTLGDQLAKFLKAGGRHFIIPVVSDKGYEHVRRVFEAAGCRFQ